MTAPLPILLSIPHGGTETPPSIRDTVILTEADRFHDGDAYTREIYNLGPAVQAVLPAAIARAFVDLNRAPDDRPPGNPDGVVKTATCHNRPIYRTPLAPAAADDLIARYHQPYHRRLATLARTPGLRVGLDCHSMAAAAPAIAPEPGQARPLFCLSDGRGTTAPPALTERLASAIVDAFRIDPSDVRINDPFQGGFIIHHHGQRPLPWIQVEMNRTLYLADPWWDATTLASDPARLSTLRRSFQAALVLFGDALD